LLFGHEKGQEGLFVLFWRNPRREKGLFNSIEIHVG
jgi:hypothetical protein